MSKTVIELAKEAGFPFNKYGLLQGDDNGEIDAGAMLERFAELVRADERAKLAEQPAPVQEPVAWMQDSIELYVQDRPGASYTIPLYTTPQAQPAREPLTAKEIAEFVGTHEYGPEQLKWFRLGEAAHGIKENT